MQKNYLESAKAEQEPIPISCISTDIFEEDKNLEAVKPALVKNCGIVTQINHPIGETVCPKRKIDLGWKILDQLLRTKVTGKSFGQSKLLLWKGFVCIEMSLKMCVPPYHTDAHSRHSPDLWARMCSPDPEGKLVCCICNALVVGPVFDFEADTRVRFTHPADAEASCPLCECCWQS